MRSSVLIGLLGMVALWGGASCAHHTPEDFCQDWVKSTCQTVTSCCADGQTFDADGCVVDLSAQCQGALAVDKVQAGEVKFDSGEASTCFGNITSCASLSATADTSYDHVAACANVITGYRPVGTACTASTDCEKTGDYATCYSGGGTAATGGVCAQVVRDSASCSFSFTTNELHVCADGLYCDRASFTPSSSDPPSIQDFEFSAPCNAYIPSGGSCLSPDNKPLPCAAGLYCSVTGGTAAEATCVPFLTEGATCQSSAECAAGLTCSATMGGTGETCQVGAPNLPYCYVATVCGDGTCDPGETATSCPADCGTKAQCGDGICEPGETAKSCPQDCSSSTCGDGVCDTGEGATCPQDCCGDGICEPGEDNVSCPDDCP